MSREDLFTIAEFAARAGVSKQAIYKQISNENSQLFPFTFKDGKKTLIKSEALKELYGVEKESTTESTQNATENTTISTQEKENLNHEVNLINEEKQPSQPTFNPEIQPISTDYIAFLKDQIDELKTEKAEIETHLNGIIQEKDNIIKEQSAQLAQLAQQVAQIADKALIATSQQQYLTAMSQNETIETEVQKKSFFKRLFKK